VETIQAGSSFVKGPESRAALGPREKAALNDLATLGLPKMSLKKCRRRGIRLYGRWFSITCYVA
jgi:hypothetical protein